MLETIPSQTELETLLGGEKYRIWTAICAMIDSHYEMERLWNRGYREWVYEYKYRRGGKTLCALYAKPQVVGFMVVLGRDERARFEAEEAAYSAAVRDLYHQSTTYHDGKWLMLEPDDLSLLADMQRLLLIKRRPNKKG